MRIKTHEQLKPRVFWDFVHVFISPAPGKEQPRKTHEQLVCDPPPESTDNPSNSFCLGRSHGKATNGTGYEGRNFLELFFPQNTANKRKRSSSEGAKLARCSPAPFFQGASLACGRPTSLSCPTSVCGQACQHFLALFLGFRLVLLILAIHPRQGPKGIPQKQHP